MDQVAKLTMRQVSLIYYRPRNKKTGVPLKIDPHFGENESLARQQFFEMGLAFGKSIQELEAAWENRHGDSSGQSREDS